MLNKKANFLTFIFSAIFIALVIIFFCNDIYLPSKVCYPTFILALGILTINPRKLIFIVLALFFSAIGDWAGSLKLFIPQIVGFAITHIFYIIFFLKKTKKRPHSYSIIAIIGAVFYGAFFIIPNVESTMQRIAVSSYLIIITGMLYSVLQYTGVKKAAFVIAALLFVFSDSMIAWTRFVDSVPNSSIIIMVTYYLAQYIFFLYSIETKKRT